MAYSGCPRPAINTGIVTKKKKAKKVCKQRYKVIFVSKYLIKKYGWSVALSKTIARLYAKQRPKGSFLVKQKK